MARIYNDGGLELCVIRPNQLAGFSVCFVNALPQNDLMPCLPFNYAMTHCLVIVTYCTFSKIICPQSLCGTTL